MAEFNRNQKTLRGSTEMDFHRFMKIIYKWRRLCLAVTLFCVLLVGLISQFVLSPIYQTNTLLMVTVASDKLQTQTTVTRQVTQNGQGTTVTNMAPMPVLTMNTYLGQLKSDVVMERVLKELNLPNQNIADFSKTIDAKIVTDSNLIQVKVKNEDPVLAAQIANTLSKQYLKLMDEHMFSSVVVISPAMVPVEPIKPNKTLNVEIALVLGMMLAIFLAFLLEYFDNTIKTAEDVDRTLELPVLGIIPLKNDQNIRQN